MDQPDQPCADCGEPYADHPVHDGEDVACAKYVYEAVLPQELTAKGKLRHPWIQSAIFSALEMGCSLRTAALAAGISDVTLKKWIARGEDGKTRKVRNRYTDFLACVRLAEAKSIARNQAIVANDAVDNAETAKWMLERQERSRYAPSVVVLIQQEREALADAMEREFKNEPEVLARLFATLAGVVLPRSTGEAAEPRTIGSGSTPAAAGGAVRPAADEVSAGGKPGPS